MKKKFTRIFGVGLIVTVLAMMLVAAAPAAATDNKWEEHLTPSMIPFYALYPGATVVDIAVYGGGEEIFIVTGTDNFTYKSTDGGATWSRPKTIAEADMTPNLIAVAPDDPSRLAIADTVTGIVKVSTTGGAVWSTISPVAVSAGSSIGGSGNITDLAIAPAYMGANTVAVSGVDDSAEGNVLCFNLGATVPSWSELKTKTGFGATGNKATSVDAIAFSPNYPSDLVMVAVTANASTTANDWVYLEIYSAAHAKWNASAGTFSGYPVTVASGNYTGVTKASIALDPEYLGSDDVLRNSFVGLTLAGTDSADSGLYRYMDVLPKTISGGNIYSVDYNGSILVAGKADSTQVLRCLDPMGATPVGIPSSSLKCPGGTGNTTVAWVGTNLAAGTMGANSAYAISRNDGKTFNDISMIDTTIATARDFVLTGDASTLYYVTDNGTYLSLWRQAPGWERVLTVADTDYIVRIAPDDADVVYVGKKGDTTLYYSKDGGAEKWYSRVCGVGIQDLAVESTDVAYALSAGGSVTKTTNAGFTWSGPPGGTATKLNNGYSLVCVSEDNLLVGSDDGFVAYSTDGNTSWTKIIPPVEAGADCVVVAADADYANNNKIYAASNTSGKNIMEWVIGTSTSWLDIYAGPVVSLGANESVYGLTVQGGTLYALTSNTTVGYLYQFIPPVSWDSAFTDANTDPVEAQVVFGATSSPNALRGSTGSNKLWAIKTNGTNKIYAITDALVGAGPTLIAPADGYSTPINTISGQANEILFSFERLSNATEHTLEIAYNSNFTEKVRADIPLAWPVLNTAVGPTSTNDAQWMLGTTYYWRVRATEPMNSPYSEVRSFTIQPGTASVPAIGSPVNGATNVSTTPSFSWSPVSGATKYEFQLSVGTIFAAPLVSEELSATGIKPDVTLDPGATYFWRVRSIEPVAGDWSTISNFTVAVPAEAAPPPVEIVQQPAPQITVETPPPAPDVILQSPPPPDQIAPGYIWAIIIIGAVLVIAVIVLIVRTRRTV